MCEWWFASTVSREDVLRRGRGDLHQQGDADRDTGYSWGTGAIEDEGDRCLAMPCTCTPANSSRSQLISFSICLVYCSMVATVRFL